MEDFEASDTSLRVLGVRGVGFGVALRCGSVRLRTRARRADAQAAFALGLVNMEGPAPALT